MRRFMVLLRKEIRELATPQILIPFVLTVVMFALIGNLVGSQGESAEKAKTLRLLDLDNSAASQTVIDSVEQAGFTVDILTEGDAQSALESMGDGTSVMLVVPKGFEASVDRGQAADLETFAVIRSFSFIGSRDAEALDGVLAGIAQSLQQRMLAEAAPGADPAVIAQPLKINPNVVIGDKQAQVSPAMVMSFITTQTTFVPIVLFIVIIFAAQMVATALATEKENKTLESLLAMPISRPAIVTAKMVAAGTIALISAAAYMVGMNYYMSGLTKGLGGAGVEAMQSAAAKVAEQLGLTLGLGDYALLGLSLFCAILVALAIALILGAFAENVKAVQSLLTPLIIMIMVPYMLVLFIDIQTLPTAFRTIVLAIPFSHPFLAAPSLFLGDTQTVLVGIAYQAAWFVVLVFIAGRIFSSDRLLTMRLSLSRKRRSRRGNIA
jgi:ABC-2 type transport system permease protein